MKRPEQSVESYAGLIGRISCRAALALVRVNKGAKRAKVSRIAFIVRCGQ